MFLHHTEYKLACKIVGMDVFAPTLSHTMQHFWLAYNKIHSEQEHPECNDFAGKVEIVTVFGPTQI